MKRPRASLATSCSFLVAVLAGGAFAQVTPTHRDWPQWRGPDLNGSTASENLPLEWSETKNVRWKVALPSWSGATPAIYGDRIFVMSASTAEGADKAPLTKRMGGVRKPSGLDVIVLCLNKKDGRERWRKKLAGGNVQVGKQDMSSPSPITDGEHVWTLTGTGIFTALTMNGDVVWKVDLQAEYGKFGLNWGYGASPALIEGKLIVPVLHGMTTDEPSYLVAFEPKTGKVLWRVERPTDARAESPDAYTTPVPMGRGGRTEIIISGGDCVTGHDLATGEEVWRCNGLNPNNDPYYRTVATPVVVARKYVIACAKRGPTIGVRLDGQGEKTKSILAWQSDMSFDVPSPVTAGKYVYVLHDRGFFSCIDAATGEAVYQRKRTTRATFSASPLIAPGRIYVTDQKGDTTVLATGPAFEILAQNKLDDDYTLSSIAVSGDELFIRTSTHLYCIANLPDEKQ